MVRTDKYFAQFDGVSIGDKRYPYGDVIDTADLHPAVIEVLVQQGQISSNNPTPASTVPTLADLDSMTRAQLEAEAHEAIKARMAEATDDQLRETIERHRATTGDDDARGDTGDGMGGDGSVGGTPYADLKDKPLSTLKTADLDTIAREEHVDFADAKTNADRVKAIEAKRAG